MGERRQDVTPKQRLRSKCAVASLSFCSHARQAAWFHACVPPHHRNPSNHTLEPACRPQGPSPPCNWFTLLMNAMLADWQAGVATLLAATSDSILAGSVACFTALALLCNGSRCKPTSSNIDSVESKLLYCLLRFVLGERRS